MPSIWISTIVLLIGGWHVVQAWLARRTGHIVLGAFDGISQRGKWLPWRARFVGGAVVVALGAVAVVISLLEHPPGSQPFKISVPAGWVDVSENAPPSNAAKLGLDTKALRAQGAAALAGTIDEGRVTSFEARIAQGKWEPSLDRLRRSSFENTEGMEQLAGVKPEFSDYELLDVQGVLSGRYRTALKFPDRTIYCLTYVLPVSDSRAFLMYISDARDFDKHLGEFTDVVQHARTTPINTVSFPFAPEYLPLGGLVIDALFTLMFAAAAQPVPTDDETTPKPPRRRKKSEAQSGPTGGAA